MINLIFSELSKILIGKCKVTLATFMSTRECMQFVGRDHLLDTSGEGHHKQEQKEIVQLRVPIREKNLRKY